MEQKERFRGSVRKGTVVEYFPRGQKSKDEDTSGPLVGIVHRSSDGQLDLVVFNYRGQPELKKAVYHTTHPDLYDNFGNISGAGHRVGSWEWLEGNVPCQGSNGMWHVESACSPAADCGVDDKIESLSAAMSHTVDELVAKIKDQENGLGGAIDALMAKMKELEAKVDSLSKKPAKEAK